MWWRTTVGASFGGGAMIASHYKPVREQCPYMESERCPIFPIRQWIEAIWTPPPSMPPAPRMTPTSASSRVCEGQDNYEQHEEFQKAFIAPV